MHRWNGQVAVVTGASSGIGKAIATAFVRNGLKVVGLARRSERVQETADQLKDAAGKLYSVKCDLTDETNINRAFKWVDQNVGPVSILVNNAGVLTKCTLTEGPVEAWREVIDTNLIALCICTKLAIESMKKANINGHIVHINSIGGHKVISGSLSKMYSASKFGVTALTELLRCELSSLNSKIKVTSVSPGFVDTELIKWDSLPDELKAFLSSSPKLSPEDIADSVLHAVGTPPHVQIHEMIIKPVGERF